LREQKNFLLNEGFLSADFDYDGWIVREPLALAHKLVSEVELREAA
jgi:hypothetical protein